MKKWNFKIGSNPKEIIKNMKPALESNDGFVFNIDHDKNDSATFKMRKRILYPWYLLFLNSIVVNGKLSKTGTENETDVEISFQQHFLWKLVIFTNIILGLGFVIAIVFGENSSASIYLIGIIILVVVILLWIQVHKKYEKNIQEYKVLISGILGS